MKREKSTWGIPQRSKLHRSWPGEKSKSNASVSPCKPTHCLSKPTPPLRSSHVYTELSHMYQGVTCLWRLGWKVLLEEEQKKKTETWKSWRSGGREAAQPSELKERKRLHVSFSSWVSVMRRWVSGWDKGFSLEELNGLVGWKCVKRRGKKRRSSKNLRVTKSSSVSFDAWAFVQRESAAQLYILTALWNNAPHFIGTFCART